MFMVQLGGKPRYGRAFGTTARRGCAGGRGIAKLSRQRRGVPIRLFYLTMKNKNQLILLNDIWLGPPRSQNAELLLHLWFIEV